MWVRLLALKEKGLFAVQPDRKWAGDENVRVYTMFACRPVVEESGKQGEASDLGRQEP